VLVNTRTSAIVLMVGAVWVVLFEPESMLVTPSTVTFFWFSRAPLMKMLRMPSGPGASRPSL